MYFYMTYGDSPELKLITNWWYFLIKSGSNTHKLVEVQEHILRFIKVEQLLILHMFQVQLLNPVLRVNKIQHALH